MNPIAPIAYRNSQRRASLRRCTGRLTRISEQHRDAIGGHAAHQNYQLQVDVLPSRQPSDYGREHASGYSRKKRALRREESFDQILIDDVVGLRLGHCVRVLGDEFV
ncbi:MAG: hypothetical protein U1E25_00150 [Methylocystis sp.]